MALSFTIKDVLGSLLAFVIFPLIMVFPGYVTSWALDLFDFRHRSSPARFLIALVISIAVSPIITYLSWSLVSSVFTFIILGFFAIAFGAIVLKSRGIGHTTKTPDEIKRYQIIAVSIAIGWVILAILALIDIPWGNQLYYTGTAYDLTSRVSVIDAMTRTGVPPINPGYYPGHPVRLTFLYYFWYIICSLISQIGGQWIDGRMAMIASVAWCGLGLMATIALYIRLRTPSSGAKVWKAAIQGIGFLMVSGVDVIPASFQIIISRLLHGISSFYGGSSFNGDIEHWNVQITAWVGSILWVPNHVAGMISCLAGMMLLHASRDKSLKHQLVSMVVSGLAFASAFGLSVWTTSVFAMFWGIWMIMLFAKNERRLSLMMLFSGVVAAVAISPFLKSLLQDSSLKSDTFPMAFDIRAFGPILPYINSLPLLIQKIILFVTLPANYAMELGFFFIVGLLWLQKHSKNPWLRNPFHLSEVILLSVVCFFGSFVRSTIGNNDFGWRCWLFGQFILLIWSVDLIDKVFLKAIHKPTLILPATSSHLIRRSLQVFLVIGLLTTVIDIALLRTWDSLIDAHIAVSSTIDPNPQIGKRTLAARLSYDYIQKNIPTNAIIQNNPANHWDRPIGLYGNRQTIIADQTSFGVPIQKYNAQTLLIGELFQNKQRDWNDLDQACKQYSIDILILVDIDPIWSSLTDLEKKRTPLYQNQYYAIFACGNSVLIPHKP